MEKGLSIAATLLGAGTALALAACGSAAPKPMAPKNISAPLNAPAYLPPGLSSVLKQGDAIALKRATPLLLHPKGQSEVEDRLPPGALIRLKSRMLNNEGPWWLVDTPTAAGWIAEAELLRQ